MTDSGQLQPDETLDDRGVDDVLDEGYTTAEKLRGARAKGVTSREQAEGETLDERLRQEDPEPDPFEEADQSDHGDPAPDGAVGDRRSGRLVQEAGGVPGDSVDSLSARDVGIDGGAASAEEAAVHESDAGEDPFR